MLGLGSAHWGIAVLCFTGLLISVMAPVSARTVAKTRPAAASTTKPPVPLSKDAAIIVDGASGRVLYSRNADATRRPASLTKMMTLYVLFGELEEGNLTLQSEMTASQHAAAQEPTKLNLQPGEQVDVETAIKALTVLSANDVAVVIAETISKTEAAFAERMTATARELGMVHTNFHNASGLPDDKQYTTAHDMALLGRHLAYDFPQYYGYFSVPSFTFSGHIYEGHDHLLGQFAGTDGIKTGYTRASGFNLVTSAVRDNKHIVGVVMGGMSFASRDAEMVRLLSAAFDFAALNPTVLADANAPWRGGKGPIADPFNTRPDGTPVMIASLNLTPVSVKVDAPAKLAPAVAVPNGPPSPVMASALPPASRFAVLMPVPKPVVIASAEGKKPVPPYTLKPRIPFAVVSAEPRTKIIPFAIAQGSVMRDGVVGLASQPQVVQSDISGLSLAFAQKPVNLPDAKHWAVQIGAFGTETLAKSKLAAYAKASSAAVGQVDQIVAPFTAFDGRTLYRARFGPFAEREARDICNGMMKRGETCFATVQSN
jgi:D-alanyl-D-alanine carboxypeptidase